jgi:hypothetical protein
VDTQDGGASHTTAVHGNRLRLQPVHKQRTRCSTGERTSKEASKLFHASPFLGRARGRTWVHKETGFGENVRIKVVVGAGGDDLAGCQVEHGIQLGASECAEARGGGARACCEGD